MTERHGYTGRILWVDLTQRRHVLEERDELFWRRYAGGGLAATALLLERTPPGIDPLGPENLLIFASSVVAGQPGPGLARFTTAGKSPLTGGIGETRTEGPWGVALKGCGADILVFCGVSVTPVAAEIAGGEVTFHDATDLWGLEVGPTVDALEARLGRDAHTAVIGPAGEHQVRYASIVTDRTYQASRMGLGAVMGSKRLKAVVLHPEQHPAVADPARLDVLAAEFERRMRLNDLSMWQYNPPGFACWIYLHGLDARSTSATTAIASSRGWQDSRRRSSCAARSASWAAPAARTTASRASTLSSAVLDPRPAASTRK